MGTQSKGDGWALMDGRSVGLGELMREAGETRVEVSIRHANTTGQVIVTVPESSTMLEVKRALLKTLADGSAEKGVRLLRKVQHRFANCKDTEPLGSMRELLVMGVRL